MDSNFVVVDGSNIATEGRSTPSLAQLDRAVREFQEQFPDKQVIVVVDATFGHRIDKAERNAYEEAVANGELVSPPAGAIGRGDAFLLRVAERVVGQVLSNDSFQEFHGEHPWLFESGRLIGGTPVPGVGWIFSPRSPVRGARSRAARAAQLSAQRSENRSAEALTAKSAGVATKTKTKATKTTKTKTKATKVTKSAEVTKATKAEKATQAIEAPTKAMSPRKTSSVKKPHSLEAPGEKSGPAAVKKVAKGTKEAQNKKAASFAGAVPTGKASRAKRATRTKAAKGGGSVVKAAPQRGPEVSSSEGSSRASDLETAIEVATEEVLIPADPPMQAAPATGRARRRHGPPPALNDPLTFLQFVSDHPVRSRVKGMVASFTSHGAMVDVGEMHCYAPLAGLGKPAPARARDVLVRGETRTFILMALDPPRRGAELALPEVASSRSRNSKQTARPATGNLAGSGSSR